MKRFVVLFLFFISLTTLKNAFAENSVSVLSKNEVQQIFNEVLTFNLPFDDLRNGCYARSHEIAWNLEQKGIVVEKIFIGFNLKFSHPDKPNIELEWNYHVAPAVLVRENNKLVPYMIDPTLFHKPVPLQTWVDLFKKSPLRLIVVHRNRFTYKESNVNSPPDHWIDADLEDARRINHPR